MDNHGVRRDQLPLTVVTGCPLCASVRARPQAPAPRNLYSEMLAGLLGLDEDALIRQVANVVCGDCGLIYKSRWFSARILRRLFTEQVPAHPRGWDVLSGRFTPANFRHEVEAYATALAGGDTGQQRRYQRSLWSIVDSIPTFAAGHHLPGLQQAITSGDVPALRAAQPMLERTMNEPAAYKRFSGFSARELWAYLETEVGPIVHYAELGCPLWGVLPRAARAGRRATYVVRREANYWSGGCRQDGTHCIDRLAAEPGIECVSWETIPQHAFCVLGAFQYLDHVENPRQFLLDVFARAHAVALILDDVEGGLAIQHFTGWTPAAIAWMARAVGARVHADFAHIRPSGNVLYLVSRESQ